MSMYQLAVKERRLLAEFPAFFQSFEKMLTELTQNVYRAGGSHMTIILNYDTRELIVQDDGRVSAILRLCSRRGNPGGTPESKIRRA